MTTWFERAASLFAGLALAAATIVLFWHWIVRMLP